MRQEDDRRSFTTGHGRSAACGVIGIAAHRRRHRGRWGLARPRAGCVARPEALAVRGPPEGVMDRLVPGMLALVLLLSGMDLAASVIQFSAGHNTEANPLAVWIAGVGGWPAIGVFKASFTLIPAGIMFRYRRLRIAQVGSAIACVAMMVLAVMWGICLAALAHPASLGG